MSQSGRSAIPDCFATAWESDRLPMVRFWVRVAEEPNDDTVHPADPTGCVLTDNESVRLIHRERPREESLEEDECYDHSYGDHLSDHVELVRLEPAGVRVEIPVEVETEHHVTTERLKGQFEERLAARTHRSRRARP
jgi:hypothetical protein